MVEYRNEEEEREAMRQALETVVTISEIWRLRGYIVPKGKLIISDRPDYIKPAQQSISSLRRGGGPS